MSRCCKMQIHTFFSKNISVYAIFNDQSFNDTLTNDNVSFEQLGPFINDNLTFNWGKSLLLASFIIIQLYPADDATS